MFYKTFILLWLSYSVETIADYSAIIVAELLLTNLRGENRMKLSVVPESADNSD